MSTHQDAWLSHLEGVNTWLTWHFQSTYQSRVLSIPFFFFSRKNRRKTNQPFLTWRYFYLLFLSPLLFSLFYIHNNLLSPSTPSPGKSFSFFPSFLLSPHIFGSQSVRVFQGVGIALETCVIFPCVFFVFFFDM